MPKEIPTKTKPKVAKAKPKGISVVDREVELFKRASESRYRLALGAYKAQDAETQRVIDTMVDRLRIIQTGYIRVWPDGKRNPSVAVPIEPEYQDYNILFVAMEILSDLALLDVQIANYQFPKMYCAECKERITAPKRKNP